MLLAVDAGNSRIKWGLHDGKAWLATGSVATANAAGLSEAWSALSPVPSRAIVSNVAGATTGALIVAAVAGIGADVVPYGSRAMQAGVQNGYEVPTQLGGDRWAALIAARRRATGACVVVNAGTTIVVDALTGSGEFLGGMILPGFELMLSVLAERVAGLDPAPGRFEAFPRRTADAMASGAIYAATGAIEAMAQRLAAKTGETPAILLSGGAAAQLLLHLRGSVEHVEGLVLEGLVIAAKS